MQVKNFLYDLKMQYEETPCINQKSTIAIMLN
jgi:hypothetical protein